VLVHVVPGDSLFGVGVVALRDAFRTLQGRTFNSAAVGELLELDAQVAGELFATLLEEGFVRSAERGADEFVATIRGNALANATARKPVKRAVAARNLNALIERAIEVNANPDFLHWVDRIVVFGSFLDESKSVVGDVDVAMALTRREEDGDRYIELARARAGQAELAGRTFSSLLDRLGWAEIEVRRFLKGRSNVLSFTTIGDQVLELADRTEVVYERRVD
jgi:hypothetical protein